MKKYIIIFAAALLTLVSCDEWLNKDPKATIAPDSFFTNENELQAFTNTFYDMMPATSLYNEEADNYTRQDLSDEIKGTRQIPASGGGWSWGSLRDINTLLENSANCKDAVVRARYDALARFFRAYFYFDKVKRFGDVPWYDHQLGSADPELYRARDSREFVMQKMIEDIDYAIANLPADKSLYRITKWTALALKSRFCLFEGTYRKYHNISYPEHDWQWYLTQSADAAKTFIETSGYTLYTTGGVNSCYVDLFAQENADPSEVILARDYSNSLGVRHNATFYTMGQSYGCPGMTKKIVDSYLMKDGTRYTDQDGWATKTFADEVKNRDPRLSQTIRTPGYKRIKGTVQLAPDIAVSSTGYQPIKYVQPADAGVDAYNLSYNDLIIFRAAEVFLNYAEAKAELGTLTQADIDMSIKKIRDRVGMPDLDLAAANAHPDPYLEAAATGYPNVTGDNKGVILEIRRERTVELAQEGFRYYDLMRWKEGKAFEQPMLGMYFPALGEYDLDGDGNLDICIYSGTKPATKAKLALKVDENIYLTDGTSGYISPHKQITCIWNENKDYLYPIPTDDRSLSMGKLAQNPGWDDGLTF